MLNSHAAKESQVKSVLPRLSHSHEVALHIESLDCHGVTLNFCFYDKDLIVLFHRVLKAGRLPKPVASAGIDEVNICWYSCENLGIDWEDAGDHQCSFTEFEGHRLITQRDFSCLHESSDSVTLISGKRQEDGFYNFLRYFVPFSQLQKGKYIFHSSAVIDKDKEATLFLGHSGYGKSTIAAKFKQPQILGDDMHLVYILNRQIIVEPTHLGQKIINWDLQGHKFLVKNLYWLSKSDTGKQANVVSMEPAQQKLKVLGSLSGVFWDQLDESDSKQVFTFLDELLSIVKVQEFLFSKESEVENYV